MAEKNKEFTNMMRLNGQVVRMSRLSEGTDKNGKEYVSFRGALKVGGEEGHLYDFEGMCYKLTKDGKATKSYERAENWFTGVYNAIQNDSEIPEVYVSLSGSLEPRDYVASSGELREINSFRVSQILDFAKDPNGDDAYVAIDGFIRSLKPEIDSKTEEETGRYIMSLVSTTFRNEAVVIPKIIIEEEAVDYVNENFEVGSFARITLGFSWTESSVGAASKVGIGRMKGNIVSRPVRNYYLMGMDVPMEDDNIKENKALMKTLLSERQAKLDAIEEEGYKGSSDKSKGSTNPRKGFGKAKSTSEAEYPEDDDIPF